jgi:glycosyltransferase involved in cell wall biosynthesis
VARLLEISPALTVQLDLVGDGEARPGLERLAARSGIGDRVTFHGYLDAEAFVPLLAASHVCVSPDPPTPFNDVSTMTKVVEYLAVGRPVVAFDLAETRTLVGDAGVIVADATARGLADALAALALDRPRLAVLSEAAAGRIAALDLRWERSAERLLAAYDTLLDETRDGTAPPTG